MIPTKTLGGLIDDMESEISDLRFNIRIYGGDPEFRNGMARMKLERLEREVAELNSVYEFIVQYNEEHKNEQ